MATVIARPGTDECAEYYLQYADLAPDGDILAHMAEQIRVLERLLGALTEEQAACSFAPGEWTIKQVVGHLVDAERIMGYRAYTIARDETAVLPGFNQDYYAEQGDFNSWTLAEMLEEFGLLRRANLIAFRHLTAEQSTRRGVASGNPVSVRAQLYILAGHVNRHVEDLREQYGCGEGVDRR